MRYPRGADVHESLAVGAVRKVGRPGSSPEPKELLARTGVQDAHLSRGHGGILEVRTRTVQGIGTGGLRQDREAGSVRAERHASPGKDLSIQQGDRQDFLASADFPDFQYARRSVPPLADDHDQPFTRGVEDEGVW